jgi:chromosome partitioning protein
MPVVIVANPKGGVGKSTLATNLAGMYAHRGHAVMLGDTDRQKSAKNWIGLRPALTPVIRTWAPVGDDDAQVRIPKGTTHAVLDTPAGLKGKRLDNLLKIADKVLVPLQPSLFDIQATSDFIGQLRAHRNGASLDIAIVGNRARDGTIALDQLRQFLDHLGVPVLGYLRDTQNYVQLAARGLTLWDVAPSKVERDLEQWQPLVSWALH